MRRIRFYLAMGLTAWAFGGADRSRAAEPHLFRDEVATLLSKKCFACHNNAKSAGGFSLQERERFLVGGDSGEAVVPGKPDESSLLQRISGDEPEMPKDAAPLSTSEVALVRKWIADGADWPDGLRVEEPAVEDTDWWSLRPLAQPSLPHLSGDDALWVRTQIDAFVVAKLRAEGLHPNQAADRRTLIRRLYFDLVGLPPDLNAVDAFVGNDEPDAYEQLVEELLASPHYGEKWARHWLDVVHYGDTHGYDKDKPRPNAWPYRDYVIRSFNDDKPYGRFVMEQIAGDVLWPGTRDGVEGTGFIAAGPWDFIGHAEVPETKLDGKAARNLDRDDMASSTMNTFASLTVQCARCHNHKFDPVAQEHYYSLQAVFAAVDRADRDYDLDPQVARQRGALRLRETELTTRQRELQSRIAALGGERLAAIDKELAQRNADVATSGISALGDLIADLTSRRRNLLDEVVPAKSLQEMTILEADLAATKEQLAALPAPSKVFCGTVYTGSGAFVGTGGNGGRPREIYVLDRGDIQSPRKRVAPGTVPVIAGVDWRFDLPDDHSEGDRRSALARWLVRPDNPLTWRSIVNRVWLYHFGRGIVDSPNDFGRMGESPTHPELLDWLAADFRDGNQSLKDLHRKIVTSSVYRQASHDDPARRDIDADNRYLWKMNRRSLDAEAIRDAVLKVSGKLDATLYGPPFQDFVVERPEHSPHYEYHLHDPDDPASHRRSVYRFLVRSQQEPFMQSLDCADPSESVAKRNTTLTSLQAFAMMNNKFMIAMSEHFASRAASESSDASRQVDFIFRQALARNPHAAEAAELVGLTKQFGLAYACRVVFNLNEFVFVD